MTWFYCKRQEFIFFFGISTSIIKLSLSAVVFSEFNTKTVWKTNVTERWRLRSCLNWERERRSVMSGYCTWGTTFQAYFIAICVDTHTHTNIEYTLNEELHVWKTVQRDKSISILLWSHFCFHNNVRASVCVRAQPTQMHMTLASATALPSMVK